MKNEYSKEIVEEVFKKSKSKSDVCRALGFSTNGAGMKKVSEICEKFCIEISHFDSGYSKREVKYPNIKKECPVCNKEFETKGGSKKEKTTCSHSCSNTYFRSGTNNPNWKNDSYRSTCFLYHKKECVICKEYKIVDVHHFDEDKNNNSIENLIPLCPNHHSYWHSRYKDEVYEKVVEYRDRFIENKKRVSVTGCDAWFGAKRR